MQQVRWSARQVSVLPSRALQGGTSGVNGTTAGARGAPRLHKSLWATRLKEAASNGAMMAANWCEQSQALLRVESSRQACVWRGMRLAAQHRCVQSNTRLRHAAGGTVQQVAHEHLVAPADRLLGSGADAAERLLHTFLTEGAVEGGVDHLQPQSKSPAAEKVVSRTRNGHRVCSTRVQSHGWEFRLVCWYGKIPKRLFVDSLIPAFLAAVQTQLVS